MEQPEVPLKPTTDKEKKAYKKELEGYEANLNQRIIGSVSTNNAAATSQASGIGTRVNDHEKKIPDSPQS